MQEERLTLLRPIRTGEPHRGPSTLSTRDVVDVEDEQSSRREAVARTKGKSRQQSAFVIVSKREEVDSRLLRYEPDRVAEVLVLLSRNPELDSARFVDFDESL